MSRTLGRMTTVRVGDVFCHRETGAPGMVESVTRYGDERGFEFDLRFVGNPRTDEFAPFVESPRWSADEARSLEHLVVTRADLGDWELYR